VILYREEQTAAPRPPPKTGDDMALSPFTPVASNP